MPKVDVKWYEHSVKKAIKNRDIVIIVDVLRFSSAVITAVANKVTIIPSPSKSMSKILAKKYYAEVSGSSREPEKFRYSLSPLSYLTAPKNTKVVLFSSNGARCSNLASSLKYVFIGGFLNGKAVANYALKISKKTRKNIMIIAAGEKGLKGMKKISPEKGFVNRTNKNYFCLEDLLGAGMIVSEMKIDKTKDASFAEKIFKKYKKNLMEVMNKTVAGRYLIETGRKNELIFCLKLNKYSCIPKIIKGIIV